MDITITNLGSTSPDDDVFLSGPKLELKAGEAKVWSDLGIADLEGDFQLKGLVAAGKVSVSVALGSLDAAKALIGSLGTHKLPVYTNAQLPSGTDAVDGMVAWCSNGRKVGEGGGAGTGLPVYYNHATTTWKVFGTDVNVTI